MQRRDLLKIATLAPLANLGSGTAHAASPVTPTSKRSRVRPTDAAWPSKTAWARLDETVGGNLIAVQPLSAACARTPDSAACHDVLRDMRNPFYLGDQPAGTQVSGWLDAWRPEPSVYAIKARTAADVVAGVNFAREHHLRLVVKGTGHSYLGTSNAADSLLIWTRSMNSVTVHDAFVPSGCANKVSALPAVTAEAGAMWIDLYDAVTTRAGRYVQGGGCTDVGVAGLVQSGGFGSFSKRYGTVSASLLEAEIVTADGIVRTVNACMNPDLFWALKGGGGGSWGVVTRLTLRTHTLPEHLGAAWGHIHAASDDAFRRLIARFVDFYAASLLNPHWGEQVSIGHGNALQISMVCHGLDQQQASHTWQPFFDWVKASTADYAVIRDLGAGVTTARSWWTIAGNDAMVPDTRADAPSSHGWWQGDQDQVGAFLHGYDSLWLPASLLKEDSRTRIVEALFAASRHQRVQLHFNKGLAGASQPVVATARNTAIHPAACDAFALAIIADGEASAYPGFERSPMDLRAAHDNARAIERAATELRKIVPDAGSYVSESNYFNPTWQQAYWGENYSRLRAIKRKYDPEGLFFVHHGVGSEEWSADGFTRV